MKVLNTCCEYFSFLAIRRGPPFVPSVIALALGAAGWCVRRVARGTLAHRGDDAACDRLLAEHLALLKRVKQNVLILHLHLQQRPHQNGA